MGSQPTGPSQSRQTTNKSSNSRSTSKQKMVTDTVKMNAEKLKQLQANVRIGGKGTVRRKKKVVHRTATTDDKKLQSSLKKLSVNNIPGIEEVNMIKDDGSVIHFNNPKVQASLQSNTFAVTGHAENKRELKLQGKFLLILLSLRDHRDAAWYSQPARG